MDDIIQTLLANGSLTSEQSHALFSQIIEGKLDNALIACVLTALKIKGESADELSGGVNALLKHAKAFPTADYDVADIVGTGGDGYNTLNISTAAAIVAAACGLKVAKHGNRSVSSKTGAFDLLECFDLDLFLPPTKAKHQLDTHGLCFLFAPHYHHGVKHAMPVRQALKTRTIFNLLGPLINPAHPNLLLLGVYHQDLITPMAKALTQLKIKRAFVVHGAGLDEVAVHGNTQVAEINGENIRYYSLEPRDFGLPTYPLDELIGGEPALNKKVIENLLKGQGTQAQNACVAMNVALLMKLFGHEDLRVNTEKALKTITSGAGYKKLEQLIKDQAA